MHLREFVHRYPAVHLGVGIFGNVAFFVGSILFLSEATKRIGVYCFIFGSLGMLLGSVGQALVRHERDTHHL